VADYDSPWKEALDLYFGAFLAFFFPSASAEIDWSRGYETCSGLSTGPAWNEYKKGLPSCSSLDSHITGLT